MAPVSDSRFRRWAVPIFALLFKFQNEDKMKTQRISLSLIAAGAVTMSLLLGASPAQAEVTLTAVETAEGDVVISGGGTLNQDEFGVSGLGLRFGKINPDSSVAVVGPAESQCPVGTPACQIEIFSIIGGSNSFNERPFGFGTGPEALATSGSGDTFGFDEFSQLILPATDPFGTYVPGDLLSGSATYAGADFATLGMEVGTYVWSWGEGDTFDSFTLNVVPEPSTALLMSLGLVGLASRRRRS